MNPFIRTCSCTLAAALLLTSSGCERLLCSSIPLDVEVSPTGTNKAMVYLRDCGATEPFGTHVEVGGSAFNTPDRRGSVFFADEVRPWPNNRSRVRIEWLNDNHLVITHHPRDRVIYQRMSHEGVRVSYRTFRDTSSNGGVAPPGTDTLETERGP